MTIDDIKRLIAPDEHRELELKKTTGELKDGMHSACAFLNTEGGWLLFGITPKSLKIVGEQVTDNTQREISNVLSGLEPALDMRTEYVDVPDHPGNKVIVMQFDGWVWGKEPYTYNGCPYYRRESTTKRMPREMFEERLKAAKPHKFGWEKQIADGCTIDDLDEKRIRAAVQLGVDHGRISPTANGESVESLMGKFKFFKDGKLTNAAVMLFAKDTGDYPQLLLRMARFVGINKNEFIDNQRVRGNFFDLLDAGMQFAYKHLNLGGKIVGLRRADKLEIPIEALREALINALCHRTYDSPGAAVSLAIYDDRLEIVNPGRLPNELTVESLMQPHDSFPMNPDVADFMFKTTYLDSWGSGVKRMVDACTEAKVPLPRYELRPGSVAIIFYRSKKTVSEGDALENVTEKTLSDLPERQRLIVDRLIETGAAGVLENALENALETSATLAAYLHVNERTIRRNLTKLQALGILRHDGPDKGGKWVVLLGGNIKRKGEHQQP